MWQNGENYSFEELQEMVKTHELFAKDSVLVKLDLIESNKTKGGIVMSAYEKNTSEGGKPIVSLADKRYQTKGEIVKLSNTAEKTALKDMGIKLEVGDSVLLGNSTVNRNNAYYLDRSTEVLEDSGLVLIQIHSIQSIIKNN